MVLEDLGVRPACCYWVVDVACRHSQIPEQGHMYVHTNNIYICNVNIYVSIYEYICM